ncbi:MAG: serine/threonine protein kinase [Deltaproteobacteria bacterium]|nr:serine/threonine protein kinase [Deltaproteobacteria bacterium]
MGEVFLADQMGPLGPVRPVALKRMLPSLAGDPGAVRSFLEEMGTAAQLNHPNIATTYDFGETDGVYFLAMEYVDGCTLDRLLEATGPITPEAAVAIGLAVLAALEVAHGRRGGPVVHQDVSPHNVMISRDGQVKLLDFGIARTEAQVLGGRLRAKIAYAAPEQLGGAPPDRRFDLYSLGVTLYEALTGGRPFAGRDADELQAAATAGLFPRLSERRPEARSLEGLVATALAPAPADRFQGAPDFRAALLSSGLTAASPEVLATLVEQAGLRPPPEDDEITGTGVAAIVRSSPTGGEARAPTTRVLPGRSRPYTYVAVAFVLGGLGTLLWRLQQPAPADPIRAPGPAMVVAPDAGRGLGAVAPTPTGTVTAEWVPEATKVPQWLPEPAPAPRRTVRSTTKDRRAKGRAKPVVEVAPAPPAPATPNPVEAAGGLGVLAVRTRPWATVALDGQPLGDGIIVGKPVTAGKHRLTLTPGEGGYEPRTIEVDIRPGGVTKIFADFGTGEIRVQAP